MQNVYQIKTVKGQSHICFDDIKYFRADGSYTWIVGLHKETIVTKNLGFIEKDGIPATFFRIHGSILLNMEYILNFNGTNREVTLIDGSKLKIAVRRLPEFRKKTTLIKQIATLIK